MPSGSGARLDLVSDRDEEAGPARLVVADFAVAEARVRDRHARAATGALELPGDDALRLGREGPRVREPVRSGEIDDLDGPASLPAEAVAATHDGVDLGVAAAPPPHQLRLRQDVEHRLDRRVHVNPGAGLADGAAGEVDQHGRLPSLAPAPQVLEDDLPDVVDRCGRG